MVALKKAKGKKIVWILCLYKTCCVRKDRTIRKSYDVVYTHTV